MGKKRNREKAQVKETDMATNEGKDVSEVSKDLEIVGLATPLPCTPCKNPSGKKVN